MEIVTQCLRTTLLPMTAEPSHTPECVSLFSRRMMHLRAHSTTSHAILPFRLRSYLKSKSAPLFLLQECRTTTSGLMCTQSSTPALSGGRQSTLTIAASKPKPSSLANFIKPRLRERFRPVTPRSFVEQPR